MDRNERFGWCSAGQHGPSDISAGCPGALPEHRLPDPARAGTFFTAPARVCACGCHNRVESEFPR